MHVGGDLTPCAFSFNARLCRSRRQLHESELTLSRSRSKDMLVGSYNEEHRRVRGACRICRRMCEKELQVARVHTDFQPAGQEPGQLHLKRGDMIVLSGYDEDASWWSGAMRNRPSHRGDFPRKCVEIISTKAVAWSGKLAEDDALALLYITVQPYCLWHLPWTLFWHGPSRSTHRVLQSLEPVHELHALSRGIASSLCTDQRQLKLRGHILPQAC